MYDFYEYIPVGQKKLNAQKQIEKLRKKNPDISPVIIEGSKIATKWWGISWNKNLENYADYSNRIDRGRSYVKNGFVIDLKIYPGIVEALVMGSSNTPYKVRVDIEVMSQRDWNRVVSACSNKISNLDELISGKFPIELQELFTMKNGLFPSSSEIDFSCSCPDWASMCKHVSAVLFAIGAKFDEDPLLFFKLRGIDFEYLIKKSVDEKLKNMMKNSEQKSKRVIEDEDIDDIFGL